MNERYNCFGKNFKSTYIAPACLSVFLLVFVANIVLFITHQNSKPYRRLLVLSFFGFTFFSILAINPSVFVKPFNRIVRRMEDCPDFYSEEKIRDIFPLSAKLEDAWEDIRKEAIHVKYSENIGKKYITAVSGMWKGWDTSNIRLFGNDNKKNMDKCPILKSIIKNDSSVETAFFSLLEPGKRIPKHSGPYAGILRYHLGLKIPKEGDVFINLNNKKYSWVEGEGVLFDETYPHYVHNDSEEDRIILFIDIKRKFVSPTLNKVNNIILKAVSLYSRSLV